VIFHSSQEFAAAAIAFVGLRVGEIGGTPNQRFFQILELLSNLRGQWFSFLTIQKFGNQESYVRVPTEMPSRIYNPHSFCNNSSCMEYRKTGHEFWWILERLRFTSAKWRAHMF